MSVINMRSRLGCGSTRRLVQDTSLTPYVIYIGTAPYENGITSICAVSWLFSFGCPFGWNFVNTPPFSANAV